MPNILVGYEEKDAFIVDKINEFAPISLDDFTDMLNDDYGHYKPTMIAYISQSLSQYINKNVLETKTYLIDDDKKEKIFNILVDDIYTMKYIRELFSNLGIDINENVFTRANFDSIGYCLRNGYVIKKEYGSINKYLDIKSKTDSIIKIDIDLLKSGVIYNTINDYCKNYNIFKVRNGIYVSKLKMDEEGVDSEYINSMFENLKDKLGDTSYFSVENVKNELEISSISNLGFDDEFIENIIFYNNDISTLRINNHKLFSYINKKPNIETFIEDELEKYRIITISELVDEINEDYSIDLTYDVVRGYVYRLSNVYYSQSLDKLYIDKEDFYKEIYDE